MCTREPVSLCLRALRLSERPCPLLACPDITVSNVSSECGDLLQPGQACLGVTLTHPYPAPNPNLPGLPASCQRRIQIWKAVPGGPPSGEGHGPVKTQEQPEWAASVRGGAGTTGALVRPVLSQGAGGAISLVVQG